MVSATAAPPKDWVTPADLLVPRRPPTADEVEAIELVHGICREWTNGLPGDQIRQLCDGRERWTAARFTPPAHVMFGPLMEMLDELIRTDVTDPAGMHYWTRYGTFNEHELRGAKARVTRATDGRLRILFPIHYPWIRKPDPEHGDAGEAGVPVYAETAEDRMRIANQPFVVASAARRNLFE